MAPNQAQCGEYPFRLSSNAPRAIEMIDRATMGTSAKSASELRDIRVFPADPESFAIHGPTTGVSADARTHRKATFRHPTADFGAPQRKKLEPAACFVADRLDLSRVGFRPDPRRMPAPAGLLTDAVIDAAMERERVGLG